MTCDTVRIAGVTDDSTTDGPGFRLTIFTQGCPHHCIGCHNPQTHDFFGGRDASIQELCSEFSENTLTKGVTFSGGEPMCQPAPLAKLAKRVHELGGDVIVYTGYTYEQLIDMHNADTDSLLAETDVLIDGPFMLAERDLTLAFRGSRNQRVIDMHATRAAGHVVTTEI